MHSSREFTVATGRSTRLMPSNYHLKAQRQLTLSLQAVCMAVPECPEIPIMTEPNPTDPQITVSFQGALGAYSHRAAVAVFPDCEVVPSPSFDDAMVAVSQGEADCAVIPIENSTAGRVADIHMLLPGSGLSIIGEYFLPIHHCLLVVPGAVEADLTTAVSHVQALGQCRLTLKAMGLKAQPFSDTAGAARYVAEHGDKTMAAIGSDLAAEVHGLEILKRDIHDRAENTTRFVVLAREALIPTSFEGPALTSFTFETRNVPAALFKALGCFATNGVNMTKLESYYEGDSFQASEFYVDIEGRPTDSAVAEALRELEFQAKRIRMLGTYPQAKPRA